MSAICLVVVFSFFFLRTRGGLTMNEILNVLEDEDDNLYDIFIEPPDVADQTDEDSAEEDEGDYVLHAHHLTGNQLRAPAELRKRTQQHEMENDVEREDEDQTDISSTAGKKRQKSHITWKRSDAKAMSPLFPESNYSKYRDFSEVELFELFFDDEIIEHAMKEMTKYSLKNNWQDINISMNEFKVFLAILIVSGYNQLPRRHMYWSHTSDTFNEAISNAMRRDRFDAIKRSLHFNATSDLDKSDKFAKLRPLFSHLQKKFMDNFIPTPCISHDEAMVEYFGKHGCKQSIRNKPIRFGYKIWCQNSPAGYLIAFDPYQGKTHKGNLELEKEYGKCSATVLHLLDNYSENKKYLPYHLYFDNLFTTVPLLHRLKCLGYNGTGTLRANRLDKSCPISSTSSFEKKVRGSSETVTGVMESNNIKVTRWKDNSVVTVGSTINGKEPVAKVRRWSKEKSTHIEVPIPQAISNYNKNMGGTDQMNQNINTYRIGIRGKKWWWSLFTWTVDVSIQNAWILAQGKGYKLDQLAFRREIAMSYLLRFQHHPQGAGRKRKSCPGETDMRYDNAGHLVQPVHGNKRRRCQAENCCSQARSECSKCKVGLCVQCFIEYHTKKT